MDECERALKIRELNDRFRVSGQGGRIMMTRGVASMDEGDVARILLGVRSFKDFAEDNDPWGEHDFGGIEVGGQRILWKIDYYDRDLAYGSDDPTDPSVTTRVLTVMLAEEY